MLGALKDAMVDIVKLDEEKQRTVRGVLIDWDNGMRRDENALGRLPSMFIQEEVATQI